ncbi:hypothetical protein ACFWYW_18275 [Nonomuraea sp. NPDC059023]|uniref:hypothetical protein n=1 Tax=unclassified Nonomuraea TaxID=2593643 RepID=UPI0036ACDA37
MMIRIAVSGHRGLPAGTASLVDDALRGTLAGHSPRVVGLSCLADGADQIFARAVLDLGGSLEAVVPAARYRDSLPGEVRAAYDELLGRAVTVHRLDFAEPTSESHMVASIRMLDGADVLLAVWDGLPARGYGGTADVVAEARRRGVPVQVIWPEGARRD